MDRFFHWITGFCRPHSRVTSNVVLRGKDTRSNTFFSYKNDSYRLLFECSWHFTFGFSIGACVFTENSDFRRTLFFEMPNLTLHQTVLLIDVFTIFEHTIYSLHFFYQKVLSNMMPFTFIKFRKRIYHSVSDTTHTF